MKAILVALVLVFYAAAAMAQSPAEKQLFDLVNHEREKAGRGKLEWNDRLAQAAWKHSELLAEHQDLSHQFPGEAAIPERVGATGLRFNAVAENVAEAPGVETAHDGLMHSPGHRENILNPEYNAVGISIVQRGGELFVTQDFAHTLATYTEKQFRDALIKDFNQARRAKKLEPVKVVADPHLRKAACSQDMDTGRMIQSLPGAASLFVFSLFDPGTLPGDLRKPAGDESLDRMNIGVCLQTGGKDGFSKYWVIIAFYRPSN